jgi:intracellular sulfur oxidation DsrE/DsrF family protein
MHIRLLGALLATVAAVPAAAQQQPGPVILAGGAHAPVPNITFAAPVDLDYKVVWDIRVGAAKPADLNELFHVPARFMNQTAALGISRSRVQLAVVVHGGAGEDLLMNDEYRARKGVDNPNLALLEEMSRAGIKVILCGQTAANRKMPREKLLPFVLVAPSAALAHAALQRQGYTTNPF